MIIFHKKNSRYDLPLPLIDGASPRIYKSGASPTFVAFSQDGTGSWTSLTIADSFTEVGSTGVYEITLIASEMDHDRVFIKMTGGTTAVDSTAIFDLSPNFANFTLGPTILGLDLANTVSKPTSLSVFKKEDKTFVLTILDADGVAVDLSSPVVLRFTVETIDDPPVSLFEVSGASIAVSGASNEIANVTVTSSDTDKDADKYRWRLWDDNAKEVLQHGDFEIVDTSESAT